MSDETRDEYGQWVVIFRVGPWSPHAMCPDGGGEMSWFHTKREALDAIDGHMLEDKAVVLDLTRLDAADPLRALWGEMDRETLIAVLEQWANDGDMTLEEAAARLGLTLSDRGKT